MTNTGSWLNQPPAEDLASEVLVVARVTISDIPEIVDAVNETLDDLSVWMPWAQTVATNASIRAFIEEADRQWTERQAFQYVAREAETGRLIGCVGLHNRMTDGILEIGYWIRESSQRRGFATEAARMLGVAALEIRDVSSVAIRCDKNNHASAGVPAKLGYRLEGIRPNDLDQTPHSSGEMLLWLLERQPR